MDESFILSEFDRLQQSGLALYDDKQRIIEHVEGGLKVRIYRLATYYARLNSNILTAVSILSDFCPSQETDPTNAGFWH
jgi:hypothetical protein